MTIPIILLALCFIVWLIWARETPADTEHINSIVEPMTAKEQREENEYQAEMRRKNVRASWLYTGRKEE